MRNAENGGGILGSKEEERDPWTKEAEAGRIPARFDAAGKQL